MSSTDRNLLRLALYELLYVDEVEAAVSISECVELAKAFGSSDESSRFVNGILGRIQSEIEAGVDVVEEGRRREAEEAGELAAAADAGEAEALGYVPEGSADEADAVATDGDDADATSCDMAGDGNGEDFGTLEQAGE